MQVSKLLLLEDAVHIAPRDCIVISNSLAFVGAGVWRMNKATCDHRERVDFPNGHWRSC